MSRQMYNENRPFRQGDDRWGNDVMWDRDAVIKVHRSFNGRPLHKAEELLHKYNTGGNSIMNEGCLLTCLSMVLHLLYNKRWTPGVLNKRAQKLLYYTQAGLSNVQLYADLVCEVSKGDIQLCLKEEYLSGEKKWKNFPFFPSDSMPVRAYRSLPSTVRQDYLMMLKIGTYDDTFASHYVLADPDNPGTPDENDLAILDPIMPGDRSHNIWRLSNSADQMKKEKEIRDEWKSIGIQDLQIAGVWIFGRWRSANQKSLIGPLLNYLNHHVT